MKLKLLFTVLLSCMLYPGLFKTKAAESISSFQSKDIEIRGKVTDENGSCFNILNK